MCHSTIPYIPNDPLFGYCFFVLFLQLSDAYHGGFEFTPGHVLRFLLIWISDLERFNACDAIYFFSASISVI